MPSFEELCAKLENEFNCFFKTINKPFPATYFERIYNGNKLQCPISFNDDKKRLTPNTLRYICRRLNINPEQFGLYLENF